MSKYASILLQTVRDSKQYGDGILGILTLFSYQVCTKIFHIAGYQSSRLWKLSLKKLGASFEVYVQPTIHELCMLREIYFEDIYNIDIDEGGKKVIVDLGSNTGLSLLYFAIQYPDANIYGFEPNSGVMDQLKKNIAPYNERIEIIEGAISGSDGITAFFVNPQRSVSSSLLERSSSDKKIEVKTYSLKTFMEDRGLHRIDILKFDIEGAEFSVFSDFDLGVVQHIVGEVHWDLMPVTMSRNDFTSLFTSSFETTVDEDSRARREIFSFDRK